MIQLTEAIAKFFDNLKLKSPVGYLIVVGLLVGTQYAIGEVETSNTVLRTISTVLTLIAGAIGTSTFKHLPENKETIKAEKAAIIASSSPEKTCPQSAETK